MRLGNIGSVCIMNSTIIRLHWMWCVMKWHHLIPSIVLNLFQSHCVRRVCVCSIPFSFLLFHIFTIFHWVAELHVSRFYFITDTNRYDHNYQHPYEWKNTIFDQKKCECVSTFFGGIYLDEVILRILFVSSIRKWSNMNTLIFISAIEIERFFSRFITVWVFVCESRFSHWKCWMFFFEGSKANIKT